MAINPELQPSSLPGVVYSISTQGSEAGLGVIYHVHEVPRLFGYIVGIAHGYDTEFEEDTPVEPPAPEAVGIAHEFRPMPHLSAVFELPVPYLLGSGAAFEFYAQLGARDPAGISFEHRSGDFIGRSTAFVINPEVGPAASAKQFVIPNNAPVSRAFSLRIPDTDLVRAFYELSADVSARPVVSRSFEYPYASSGSIGGAFAFNTEFTSPTGAANEFSYSLDSRDIVYSIYRAAYALQPEASALEEVDWEVYDEQGELSAIAFDIQFDEGDLAWSGSISLTDYADYERLQKDSAITLVAGGETYNLIVDGKSKSVNAPADHGMSISVVSPTVRYDFPRAEAVNKTWDQDVMAYTAAVEHIDASLDWQVIDWMIPGFRLGVDNISPIKVVSLLAEAVKATVETTREGELYVRPLYYHSTEFFYEDLVPDYELNDTQHVFTLQETYSTEKLANRIRIRDVQFTYADSMKWVADENSSVQGDLRAFPSPYRSFELAPVVTTAEAGVVNLLPVEEVEFEIEEAELVEIYEGQGQTKYPIYELVSVVWESEPLSGFAFESGSKDIRSTDPDRMYALMRVVYKTRYHLYRVDGTIDRAAQFLMMDLTEE